MRLFLGIDLPAEEKNKIRDQISNLQKQYPSFSWVAPEAYHITIHFFGEVDDPVYLAKKTKEGMFDQEEFHLYSYGVDYFMSQQITIFVTLRREKKLELLVDRIRESFPDGRFNTERFVPHITIGRCRIPSKQQYFHLQKQLARQEVDIEFKVSEISLFNSVERNKQYFYEKLKVFPLIEKGG